LGSLIGGFVSGTEGLWAADPTGQINQSGNLLVTSAQPTLAGSGFSSGDSASYDPAVQRWLPVPGARVRGDGLSYAYAEYFQASSGAASTRIHVVSLVDGADRVIYSGSFRVVLAYQPEGIYIAAVRFQSGDSPALGMWRLDPATGASIQLPNGAGFDLIDHGIAWTDYWVIGPTHLDRIDVSTGAVQTWVQTQGDSWLWFAGLDGQGNPLVEVGQGAAAPGNGSWRLFVYTAPQRGTAIADVNIYKPGVTDSHGTWLAGSDGIYLLKPEPRLLKVSGVTGGNIAGRCA
jgi:hypothetical protein